MTRQALDAFEQDSEGDWVCVRRVTIAGRMGNVTVERGTRFRPRTAFAGYDDFSAYLDRMAVDAPRRRP